MTVQAEFSHEISPSGAIRIAALRRLLITANRTIDRFPGQKQRITQLAIDAFIAATAVLLAYEMHSDFGALTNDVRALSLWALMMFFARPASLMLLTRYQLVWHEIRIPDVAELGIASIPPSILAVVFSAFGRPPWAVVPSGFIAMEFPLFVGMAAAMRCLRRAAYEENRRFTMGSQVASDSKRLARIPNLLSQLLPVGAANLPSPAAWDRQSLETYRNRVVLVTGAGGSIGSELSRKLARLPISRLLLLDIDETAIFELERDLEDCSSERVGMVGDVRDRDFVKHIFEQHRPQIVLHAAAYKHVPLMEANASAAILNNVIATRNLVDAAIEAGCERFLLISTDKAVKPASVMGATKRIAELVIQARAAEHAETRFACVRFGNILGSRGSVVPLFLRQIEERRPVTITDPRMERYFMSGAQAADFALLACTLGKSGEIYVFETDKSIRIVDLACKLAEASGLTANHKIEFSFTGIRPGEKLQESFWEDDSVVSPTRFPGISALGSSEILEDLENKISKLEQLALKQQNDAIRAELQTLPIRYTPAHRSPMT